MVAHRVDADAEPVGDLVAVQSLGNKSDYLLLPACHQLLFLVEEANLLCFCIEVNSPRMQFLRILLQDIADDQHQPSMAIPIAGKNGHLMEEPDVASIRCLHPIVIDQLVIHIVIPAFKVTLHL